jgi:hypothetical protein
MPQNEPVGIACFESPLSSGEPVTSTDAKFVFGPINSPLPHGAGYVYSLDGAPEVTYIPVGNDNKVLDVTFTGLALGFHNFKCHSINRYGVAGLDFDFNWEIV